MSIANPFARMKAVTAALLAALVLSVMAMAPAAAGPAGWEALKNGTAFVIMRHALAPGTGDPENFTIGECATQRNLSAAGQQQARATGELFRASGIDKAEVWSSAWCRCRETAELLALGEVRTLAPLNSFFRRQGRRDEQTSALKDWLKARTSDMPLVLVTHQVNISALTGVYPRSGELIFVEIDDTGSVRVIDRAMN